MNNEAFNKEFSRKSDKVKLLHLELEGLRFEKEIGVLRGQIKELPVIDEGRWLLEQEALNKKVSEYHQKIVDLHTELQGVFRERDCLRGKLNDSSAVHLKVVEVLSTWIGRDLTNGEAISKINDVLHEYDALISDVSAGTVSVKVMAQKVTPKQMSEIMEVVKED